MRRRTKRLIKRILLIVLLLLVIGAGVWALLWWNGVLLPSWVVWNERLEATDGGGRDIVESVVLKEQTLVVYSAGSEVYRAPSDWKVQDALWTDIDGDETKEIVMLAWVKDRGGLQVEGLTCEGGIGYSQHLFVFDGPRAGMNEVFASAPLVMEAVSLQMDNGRLIIAEHQGKLTLWSFGGTTFVPAR